MSDVIGDGGSVTPSSHLVYSDNEVGEKLQFMLGVILFVYPSDNKNNLTGRSDQQNRGTRHECYVMAGRDIYHPNLLLKNVIIPPAKHSGIDNYEEDLPRGCSQLIDGSNFDSNFSEGDYGKLDGEWCIVGFVNGNIQYPFIVSWWSHPYNTFDPATSGVAYDGKSLVQCDTNKNRSRSLRTINGTTTLVNREGSVYLDTSQAGRKVTISDGKQTITKYAKGGHVQVDIKKSAQLEINFNDKVEKGPRLGAGSTKSKPVHDPDLPHPDQPITSTTAKARETTRTYIRGKAYKLFAKTSGLSVFCEDTSSEDDGQKGEFTVQAHDQVSLAVQPDGGTSTFLVMDDGTITAMTKDGCSVAIGNDQVLLLTKSGGQVSVIGGQISITGPSGITTSVPATFGTAAIDGIMLGTSYVASQKILFTEWDKMLNGFRAYIEAIKTIVDTGPKYPITKALDDLIQSMITAKATHEASFAKYVSVQVKSL